MARPSRLLHLLGLVAALFLLLGGRDAHAAKFTSYYNFPGLDWYMIQTEHFNVFYPVSKKTAAQGNEHYVNGEWSARKTALVAEEMYPKICGQFNFYLKETVNIVLLEYLDELEGYTVPNFDWIVISTHHSDLLWRWRGHHDWLRVVLYHEYAHVVSLKAEGVYAEEGFGWILATQWRDSALNTNVGLQVFVSSGPPWFWVEGGAEYYTQCAGINNWSSNRDMFMRMDILQGTLLTLGDMQDYYGANGGFDGERHYNEGYNFAIYLEEKFGQGVYQSFALNRSKKGWSPDWMDIIEDTLHVSAEELYEGWKQWATEKYKKVETEVMKDPAIGAPLVMSKRNWESDDPQVRAEFNKLRWIQRRKAQEADGRHNLFQRYSPDGRFFSSYDYFGQITVQEVPEETWPAISGVWSTAENEEITAERAKRTADLSDYVDGIPAASQFDWKPDSSGIVFVCPEEILSPFQRKSKLYGNTRGGFDLNMLCTADLVEKKKGKETSLAFSRPKHIPNTMRAQDPAYSPDGQWLAWSRFEDGTQNLMMVNVATGDVRQLTHWADGNRIETIDWSLDGKQLVMGVFRQNQQDVYTIHADGTGLKPIMFDKYEDRDVFWGSDGFIYFSSDRVGGVYNIFRFNPAWQPSWRDGDADGVRDGADKCVAQPEVVNGWMDEDGCPDDLPVRLTAEGLEVTPAISFETDGVTLAAGTGPLLEQVARALNEHPEVTGVAVGGFVPVPVGARGKPDLLAGERRASQVRDALTSRGVAAERLSLVGGTTAATDASFLRVEFRITARDPQKVLAAPAGGVASVVKPPDLEHARLVQISNVVGGAFTPWITARGNMVYSQYTAFGWKNYGLAGKEFLNRIVDDTTLDYLASAVKLDVQEEMPGYQEQTSKVGFSGVHVRPPLVVPILSFENISRSHMGFNAGLYLQTDDYLDNGGAFLYAQFGEVTVVQGGLTIKKWWPNISLFGTYGQYKYDYAYNFDEDENPATTDDQFTGDIKGSQYVWAGGVDIDIPLNPLWTLSVNHFSVGYGFRGPSEGKAFEPYAYRARNELATTISNFTNEYLYSSNFRINPRGGRRFNLSWALNYTDVVYASTNGIEADDYQQLGNTLFNEFQFQYNEFIPIDIKTANKTLDHSIQLDFLLGAMDRNVGYGDEFRAGGGGGVNYRNPWASNTLFAGYPSYSLAGETMIILNAAYRFPIRKDIDRKLGILYLNSLYGQFFGTVGNLWSYKLREGAETGELFGDDVALDPSDVIREIPFVDKASQNGNYLLVDAGVELRLSANLFNRSQWDSFIRLAYGFNEIGGFGDVDGDDIYTNTDDPNITTNSSETKAQGLRFYVGIGTGW